MEVATGGFFLSYQNIKITSGFFLTRTGGVIKLLEVGMKTDRIRTDITHIIFVFIFLFGFGFGHG